MTHAFLICFTCLFSASDFVLAGPARSDHKNTLIPKKESIEETSSTRESIRFLPFSGTLRFSGEESDFGTSVTDGDASSSDLSSETIEICGPSSGNTKDNSDWVYGADLHGRGQIGITGSTGISSSYIFRSQDGSELQFKSLEIAAHVGQFLFLSGFQNGAYVAATSLIIAGGSYLQSFYDFAHMDVGFNYVDKIRLPEPKGIPLFIGLNSISFDNPAIPNRLPTFSNLNGDNVSWAGVGNSVTLDMGGYANLNDAVLVGLNSGNENWASASLRIQRSGTTISSETFGFNSSGIVYTVSGSNIKSCGLLKIYSAKYLPSNFFDSNSL